MKPALAHVTRRIKGTATPRLLFWVLFGWLVIQLIGVMIWAWATFPTDSDVVALAGAASKDTAAQAVALRAQWQQSIVGIGTGLAITPMTALLSAVVGYLLHDGKTTPSAASGSTDTPHPDAPPTTGSSS